MRVLVLYAHPSPESFHAALHRAALEGLRADGHDIDDCDLYAEGFDPVLSVAGRARYHDLAANQDGIEGYVARVQAAEALVLCFPVWNFGLPAMLKGFLDRVFVPGVSFHLRDGRVAPGLQHIRRLVAITTYGQARYKAWWIGDPPRKTVTRYLRWHVHPRAQVRYLPLYGMNVATAAERGRFLARVRAEVSGP